MGFLARAALVRAAMLKAVMAKRWKVRDVFFMAPPASGGVKVPSVNGV